MNWVRIEWRFRLCRDGHSIWRLRRCGTACMDMDYGMIAMRKDRISLLLLDSSRLSVHMLGALER